MRMITTSGDHATLICNRGSSTCTNDLINSACPYTVGNGSRLASASLPGLCSVCSFSKGFKHNIANVACSRGGKAISFLFVNKDRSGIVAKMHMPVPTDSSSMGGNCCHVSNMFYNIGHPCIPNVCVCESTNKAIGGV